MTICMFAEELVSLIESTARWAAAKYSSRIAHLSFDDVHGEIRLALLHASERSPSRAYLVSAAAYEAIDLIRKARHRAHEELDRIVIEDDTGQEFSLGDQLAASGHTDLISPGAEDTYLQEIEIPRRISNEISKRAVAVGKKRLLRIRTSGADNTYIYSFRNKFPPDKREDLCGYYK